MANKRFTVHTSRKSADGSKTFYTRIGTAWLKDSDKGAEQVISIELEALPIDGKLVCFEPREKDAAPARDELPRGRR